MFRQLRVDRDRFNGFIKVKERFSATKKNKHYNYGNIENETISLRLKKSMHFWTTKLKHIELAKSILQEIRFTDDTFTYERIAREMNHSQEFETKLPPSFNIKFIFDF